MITPLDIQNKVFKRTLGGYSIDDVDGFLDDVFISFESIYIENMELKDKLNILEEQIKRYANLENTLKDTLVVAQTTADEVIGSAKEKAEFILAEAEFKSKNQISDSQAKVSELNHEYDKILLEYNRFKNKYISFLKSQLYVVDELSLTDPRDVRDLDNE